MASYMYDANGKPLWYASDGTMSSPANYQGDLYQFANGQTMTGPYKPPGAPTKVGTARLDFPAPNLATLTLTDDQPPIAAFDPAPMIDPKAGRSRIFNIKPFLKKTTTQDRLKFWEGSFSFKLVYSSHDGIDSTLDVQGTIKWVKEETAPLDGSVDYKILDGLTTSTFVETVNYELPCLGSGSSIGRLLPTDGHLNVKKDNRYSGTISTVVTLNRQLVCQTPIGPVTVFDTRSTPVSIDLNGDVILLNMQGNIPAQSLNPNEVVTKAWNFNAHD